MNREQKKIHQLGVDKVTSIISALSDIMFIIDKDGRFIDYYSADPSRFLINEERIIGSSVYDIFPKEEADRHVRIFRDTIETERINSFEYSVTVNDTERFFEARISKLNENSVLSIVRDITKRVSAQKALEENEKKFRDIAEFLPEAIFETDSNLIITYANKKAFEMFGYSEEDIKKGIMILSLISKEDFARGKANIISRFNSTNRAPSKYTGIRKDGSEFPISMHSSPILINGKPDGLRGVIIDTSVKTSERIPERSDRDERKSYDIKVLVMDDEFLIREVAGKMLSDSGMIVEKAVDGEEAFEKYRSAMENGRKFDVVILDLTIPDGLGGIDTVLLLKQLDPEVKAIASSGFSEDKVINRPEDFSFKASIAKPYLKDSLVEVVLKVVEYQSS